MMWVCLRKTMNKERIKERENQSRPFCLFQKTTFHFPLKVSPYSMTRLLGELTKNNTLLYLSFLSSYTYIEPYKSKHWAIS